MKISKTKITLTQNEKDVRLHYLLRVLNEQKFEHRRLVLLTALEIGYIERNEVTIFEDHLYKDLLEDHRNKLIN